jgi:hypothetical protein
MGGIIGKLSRLDKLLRSDLYIVLLLIFNLKYYIPQLITPWPG